MGEFDRWLSAHPESLDARLLAGIEGFPAGVQIVELMHAIGFAPEINSQTSEYGRVYVTMRRLAEEGLIRWGKYNESASGKTLWHPIFVDVPASLETEEVERWLAT
jgi:hypothetical protein